MKEKDPIKRNILSHSKENSFVVPEGYFENFSNRLNERILNEQKSSARKKGLSLKVIFNSKLAMAASLLVFISISYFTINVVLNNDKSIDAQNYTEYIEYEIADFDLGLLSEFYVEEEFVDNHENYSEEDAEIIDFLILENIDIELIIDEL